MGSGGLRAEQNVSYWPLTNCYTWRFVGWGVGWRLKVGAYNECQFSSAVQPLVIVPLPPVGKSV